MSAPLALVRSVPSRRWPLVWALTVAAAAGADRSIGGPLSFGILWAIGLGAAAGLIGGLVSRAIAASLGSKRMWLAALPWASFAFAGAVYLALDLGVLARLSGEYAKLAWLALVAALFIALAGLGLGLFIAPNRRFPRGLFATRPVWQRIAFATVAVVGACVCTWIDRTVETSGYPAAHDALRSCALLGWGLGLWVMPGSLLPQKSFPASYIVVASFAAGTLTMQADAQRENAALMDRPYSNLATRWLRALSDVDLDGYSSLFGGGDCRSFDAAVNPGAEEIPANGIDDNCRRGDAPTKRVDTEDIPVPTEPSPRSVILITIDTLSASRMSLYGAKRRTTPHLLELAKESVVFDRAYSSGGWTSLAMSSLFRGLYPRRLQWTRLIESNRMNLYRVADPIPKGEARKTSFGLPLEDPREPLAYWLQRRGMFTMAVVSDRQSDFLDPRFVGRGFDRFVDIDDVAGKDASDRDVTLVATRALADLPSDRPFFLWLHYFGPHKPDERHREVPNFGKSRKQRYDHEVAYADLQVHSFLQAVQQSSRANDAAIIITADHGEQFDGDWRGHGGDVEEPSIHIPLLLSVPGVAPQRVQAPASLVDVFATILALTNTPSPPSDGLDLLSIARGEVPARVLFSETWRFNARGAIVNDRLAAFDGKLKLMRDNLKETVTYVTQSRVERRVERSKVETRGARLDDAMEQYLEENGSIRMRD